ncbi:MAG: hypothetical protein ABR499_08370 [Gemmatimonadaceae bacterium]
MASDSVRPELAAFRELEVVVRRAARELAATKRREEPELLEDPARDAVAPDLRAFDLELRLANLERENAMLRQRLAAATARARQMLERVHFLRQQTQVGGER